MELSPLQRGAVFLSVPPVKTGNSVMLYENLKEEPIYYNYLQIESHVASNNKFKRHSFIKRQKTRKYLNPSSSTLIQDSSSHLQISINADTTTHYSIGRREQKIFPDNSFSSKNYYYNREDSEADIQPSKAGKTQLCCGKSKGCTIF